MPRAVSNISTMYKACILKRRLSNKSFKDRSMVMGKPNNILLTGQSAKSLLAVSNTNSKQVSPMLMQVRTMDMAHLLLKQEGPSDLFVIVGALHLLSTFDNDGNSVVVQFVHHIFPDLG